MHSSVFKRVQVCMGITLSCVSEVMWFFVLVTGKALVRYAGTSTKSFVCV